MAILPLEHVRAVVLTQAWAGALTTQLLGDMGAEVIQVEALSRPDVWRGALPPRPTGLFPNGDPGERSYNRNALFNAVNRNKLGITLDLNTEDGKGLFLELVGIADLVVENYAARVLPNFGLEYPVLHDFNPSVILLRMPSFGASGPYSLYPGNGGTTEPMSGISSLLGYGDGVPLNSGVMHTDAIGGVMGFAALLIAIHHRQLTGEGQFIDMSQQEAATTFIADQVMEYTMTGELPEQPGNRSATMAPHGNYRCVGTDSWVAIAVRSDDEWRRLCEAMGNDDLAYNPRFSTVESRLRQVDELDKIVESWTREHEAKEIAKLLQKRGIPSAAVLKALEVAENPQLNAREFFEEDHHPEAGSYKMTGMSWKLSRTPGRVRIPAPGLGQHSARVLQDYLGVENEYLAELENRGVTGDTLPAD